MGNTDIEKLIQEKGLTAPRVTAGDIALNVSSVHYFTALDGVNGVIKGDYHDTGNGDSVSLGLLTFCVIVLKNGFTVVGKSACASPENFDAEIGKKIAYENAFEEIGPLMGYALKDRLSREAGTSETIVHQGN